MPQFTVHRKSQPANLGCLPAAARFPSDLLANLNTRIVVPLCLASAMQGSAIKTLGPAFDIAGEPYAMLTPQLAGVS